MYRPSRGAQAAPARPAPEDRRGLRGLLGAVGAGRRSGDGPEGAGTAFYDRYGALPDELADAWDTYHARGADLTADPEINALYAAFEAEVKRGRGKVRSVTLRDRDRLALIEVFRELGRAIDETRFGGVWFLVSHDAEQGGDASAAESMRIGTARATKLKTINDWVENIFRLRPEAADTTSATYALWQRLLAVGQEAQKLARPAHRRAVVVYETTEEIVGDSVDGARWLVEDLVLGSSAEGHERRGEQMLAHQLIAQHKSLGEASILARSLASLKDAAHDGALLKDFYVELLGRDDGRNLHAFYRRISGLSEGAFVEAIVDSLPDLPPELAAGYEDFVHEEVRRLTLGVSSLTGEQRFNHGPVDLDSLIKVTAQLVKKVNPHRKVTFTRPPGRAQRSLDDRVRGAAAPPEPKAESPERAVQVLRRTPEGFTGADLSAADQLSRHVGADPKLYEAILAIVEDLRLSERFKHGVHKLSGLPAFPFRDADGDLSQIRFRRLDCKTYPMPVPRSGRGARIIFSVGPRREILLYGAYANHAAYDTAVGNL